MRTISSRTSTKGMRFTADYIDYTEAMLRGQALLWGSKPVLGFYIIFTINTGLRVSDVLATRHAQLFSLRPGDYVYLTEKKTNKPREVQINSKVIQAYQYLIKELSKQGALNLDDYVFKSRKRTVYTVPTLNTTLKEVFAGQATNVSTHSLRKSFGRHVYDLNGRTEDALIKLSEIFQHSSMAITRTYLGLRREEIGNIYMNL